MQWYSARLGTQNNINQAGYFFEEDAADTRVNDDTAALQHNIQIAMTFVDPYRAVVDAVKYDGVAARLAFNTDCTTPSACTIVLGWIEDGGI